MSEYIHKLIAQGEHQQLDFKFEISDSRKIARSLVAFANTDGGRLLVGVKDNGVIAGVRTEEEYYMVEAAAQLYCKPELHFTTKEWEVDGKLVLEIHVPKAENQKHKAPHKDDIYMYYIRVKDQNLLATSTLLQLWRREKSRAPIHISFTEPETVLLKYLSENHVISLKEYMGLAAIKKRKAEKILVDFLLTDIIKMEITEKNTLFKLVNHEILNRLEYGAIESHYINKV